MTGNEWQASDIENTVALPVTINTLDASGP